MKTIIKDAFKILAFIYNKGITNSDEIIKDSDWDYNKVKEAVKFLEKESLIEQTKQRINGLIWNIKCDNEGIKRIENKEYSKNEYGVIINFDINVDSIFKTDIIFKASVI